MSGLVKWRPPYHLYLALQLVFDVLKPSQSDIKVRSAQRFSAFTGNRRKR